MLEEALKTIYSQEKGGLMHLSEVRNFNACDIKTRNPERTRTTLCSSRQKSVDRINTEFPAF
eukprot:12124946-Prorocentrum_lima.AAC.1